MLLAILTLIAQMTASPSPPAVTPESSATPSASPAPTPSESPAITSPESSPSATPSAAPLAAIPVSLALTPAQQQIVTFPDAALPLTATLDRRLVILTIDRLTSSISVTATQATGTDTLHVTDARGASVDVPVRVAFRAGSFSPSATLKVTGSPIDPQWLARQVGALVQRMTSALPGATATIAPVDAAPDPPVPGAQTQFDVPVRIGGNAAYYDVTGTTAVSVQNVPAEPFAPGLLFYDDDPERVNADGVLYRGTIDALHPTRLYYYHDGGMQARRVVVLLSTQSQYPASVHVIDSTAGPNLDVMSVGHAATRNFLANKSRNQGTIVDVAPDTPVILDDVALQYRQGVSGGIGMRVLSGGPVTVTVAAVSPGVDPKTIADGELLPGDGHHRSGAFSIAGYGTASLAYQVGGADAKFVYGDREPTPPNVDPASPGHDYGDYGVLWNLAFTLTNPTPEPATVYLYERPIGGIVRSSFLLDGTLVEMGCVRVPVPYRIGAYSLGPNATYRLNVQTMTDGGSNYPIEVGITQTVPQPSAPPINSADGCFPK